MKPLTKSGNTFDSTSKTVLVRKGAWTQAEDSLLRSCIEKHGSVKWSRVPLLAGLNRCRKSCRLRWLNYLDPRIKRGAFDDDEEDLIIRLHKLLGNRWSLIAGRLPGRTANDVKNYWNCHLSKKVLTGDRKDGGQVRLATPIRPQPRTILAKWSWPRTLKTSHFKPQHGELAHATLVEEHRTSSPDHCREGDVKYNKETIEGRRQVEFSSDNLEGINEDEGLFLEGISRWENILSEILS